MKLLILFACVTVSLQQLSKQPQKLEDGTKDQTRVKLAKVADSRPKFYTDESGEDVYRFDGKRFFLVEKDRFRDDDFKKARPGGTSRRHDDGKPSTKVNRKYVKVYDDDDDDDDFMKVRPGGAFRRQDDGKPSYKVDRKYVKVYDDDDDDDDDFMKVRPGGAFRRYGHNKPAYQDERKSTEVYDDDDDDFIRRRPGASSRRDGDRKRTSKVERKFVDLYDDVSGERFYPITLPASEKAQGNKKGLKKPKTSPRENIRDTKEKPFFYYRRPQEVGDVSIEVLSPIAYYPSRPVNQKSQPKTSKL